MDSVYARVGGGASDVVLNVTVIIHPVCKPKESANVKKAGMVLDVKPSVTVYMGNATQTMANVIVTAATTERDVQNLALLELMDLNVKIAVENVNKDRHVLQLMAPAHHVNLDGMAQDVKRLACLDITETTVHRAARNAVEMKCAAQGQEPVRIVILDGWAPGVNSAAQREVMGRDASICVLCAFMGAVTQ